MFACSGFNLPPELQTCGFWAKPEIVKRKGNAITVNSFIDNYWFVLQFALFIVANWAELFLSDLKEIS